MVELYNRISSKPDRLETHVREVNESQQALGYCKILPVIKTLISPKIDPTLF